jgi:hypothetical protein
LIAACNSFVSVGKAMFLGPHGGVDRRPRQIFDPQRAACVRHEGIAKKRMRPRRR